MNFQVLHIHQQVVSIPYRHAKNTQAIQRAEDLEQFQFLIGTLKTKNQSITRCRYQWFQFLIGTLKTLKKKGLYEDRG